MSTVMAVVANELREIQHIDMFFPEKVRYIEQYNYKTFNTIAFYGWYDDENLAKEEEKYEDGAAICCWHIKPKNTIQ